MASKPKLQSMESFMKAPKIGTRLKMLGVPKSFFTKKTEEAVRQYVQIMWQMRKAHVLDINTWNEAALVYGHIPLWVNDPMKTDTDISIGADVEVSNDKECT